MANQDYEVEAALEFAIALAEEGWSYAPDYFRAKWKADERIQELRKFVGVSSDEPLPTDWAKHTFKSTT